MPEIEYKSPRTGRVYGFSWDNEDKAELSTEDFSYFANKVEQLETGNEQTATGAAISGAVQGLGTIPGSVVKGVGGVFGVDPLVQAGRSMEQSVRENFPIDPTRESDITTGIGKAMGQAVGLLGTGGVVGFGTKAAQRAVLGIAGTMGASEGVESAEADGLTGVRRYAEIVGKGALAVGVERLSGLGNKDFLKNLTGARTLAGAATRASKTVLGEGAEESIEAFGGNILGNLTRVGTGIEGPDILTADAFKQYGEAAIYGAAGGTVFAAAQLAATAGAPITPEDVDTEQTTPGTKAIVNLVVDPDQPGISAEESNAKLMAMVEANRQEAIEEANRQAQAQAQANAPITAPGPVAQTPGTPITDLETETTATTPATPLTETAPTLGVTPAPTVAPTVATPTTAPPVNFEEAVQSFSQEQKTKQKSVSDAIYYFDKTGDPAQLKSLGFTSEEVATLEAAPLSDPYAAADQINSVLSTLDPELLKSIPASGIREGNLKDIFPVLHKLLSGDPTKSNVGSMLPTGMASSTNLAEGYALSGRDYGAFKDSFTIIGNPVAKNETDFKISNGVAGVLVNPRFEGVIPQLQVLYPGVNFVTASNLGDFLRGLSLQTSPVSTTTLPQGAPPTESLPAGQEAPMTGVSGEQAAPTPATRYTDPTGVRAAVQATQSLPDGYAVDAEVSSYGEFNGKVNITFEGKPVGYISVDYDYSNNEVRVNKSEIDKEHRGKGLAKATYIAINEALVKNGLPPLKSDNRSLTPDAVRLWKSLEKAGLARQLEEGIQGYEFIQGKTPAPAETTPTPDVVEVFDKPPTAEPNPLDGLTAQAISEPFAAQEVQSIKDVYQNIKNKVFDFDQPESDAANQAADLLLDAISPIGNQPANLDWLKAIVPEDAAPGAVIGALYKYSTRRKDGGRSMNRLRSAIQQARLGGVGLAYAFTRASGTTTGTEAGRGLNAIAYIVRDLNKAAAVDTHEKNGLKQAAEVLGVDAEVLERVSNAVDQVKLDGQQATESLSKELDEVTVDSTPLAETAEEVETPETPTAPPVQTKDLTTGPKAKRNVDLAAFRQRQKESGAAQNTEDDGNKLQHVVEQSAAAPTKKLSIPAIRQTITKIFGYVPPNVTIVDTNETTPTGKQWRGEADVANGTIRINQRNIENARQLEEVLREEAVHLVYQDSSLQEPLNLLRESIPEDIAAEVAEKYEAGQATEESVVRFIERLNAEPLTRTLWQRVTDTVKSIFRKIFGRAPSPRELRLAANQVLERAIANLRYSVSPEAARMDQEYLSAVEAGDMATAQRLVEEAAKVAGYNQKGFHRTTKRGITTFKKEDIGTGVSFSGDAGFYFSFSENDPTASVFGSVVYPVFLKTQNPAPVSIFYNVPRVNVSESAREIVNRFWKELRFERSTQGFVGAARNAFKTAKQKSINPERMFKNEAERLQQLGYDSIVWQGETGVVSPPQIIVLSPNQIKSADPIVRNDAGNVIPLSERFNPKASDIRYSTGQRMSVTNEPAFIKRDPEIQEAAQRLKEGKITAQEYQKIVDARSPLRKFETVPTPASQEDMLRGLGDRKAGERLKRDLIQKPENIESGLILESRLDIPAYQSEGVWIVSLHQPRKNLQAGSAAEVVAYTPTAVLNNVEFGVTEAAAINIAAGKPKSTIATMRGEYVPMTATSAAKLASDKKAVWVEIGMNPIRHSYFYDKDTQTPVLKADRVLQIGGMVLAENPTFGKKSDFRFSVADDAEAQTPEPAKGKLTPNDAAVESLLARYTRTKKKVSKKELNEVRKLAKEYLAQKGAQSAEDFQKKLLAITTNPAKAKELVRVLEARVLRDAARRELLGGSVYAVKSRALINRYIGTKNGRVSWPDNLLSKNLATQDLITRYYRADGAMTDEQLEDALINLGLPQNLVDGLYEEATAQLEKDQEIRAQKEQEKLKTAAERSANRFIDSYDNPQTEVLLPENMTTDPVMFALNDASKVRPYNVSQENTELRRSLFYDTLYQKLIGLDVSPQAAWAATDRAYKKFLMNKRKRINSIRNRVAKSGLRTILAAELNNLTAVQQRDPQFVLDFITQTFIDAGVSATEAKAIAPGQVANFQKALADVKEAAARRLIEGPSARAPIKREKVPDFLKAVRLSATDPDFKPSIPFAKANKWQVFTKDEHDAISAFDEILQDPKATNAEKKVAAMRMDEIARIKIKDKEYLLLLSEIYRNSALSNLFGTGGIQLWTPAFSMLARNLSDGLVGLINGKEAGGFDRYVASVEAFLRAASPKNLSAEFGFAFKNNVTTYGKAYEIDSNLSKLHDLLTESIKTYKTTKNLALRAKAVIGITYGSMDYVRRTYATLDNVSQSVLFKQMAEMGVLDLVLKNGGSIKEQRDLIATFNALQESIVIDRESKGDSPSDARVIAHELAMRELRGLVVDKYGEDMGAAFDARMEVNRLEAARELGVVEDTELDGYFIPFLIRTLKGVAKAADDTLPASGQLAMLTLLGFPVTALKVINRSMDYFPFTGAARLLTSKIQDAKNKDTKGYKSKFPSYQTTEQRRQREAEMGLGFLIMMVGIFLVLREKEKPPEERLFMVHNTGPRDRATRQAWRAAGNVEQAVQWRITKDSPWMSVSWAKAGLEVFTPILASLGAVFDAGDPAIRREDAYDRVMMLLSMVLGTMSRPLSSGQDVASILSGKEMSMSSRSLASQIGFRLSALTPWSAMLRNYNRWQGPRDTTSAEGAFLAMLPVVGPSLTEPGLNFFGDSLGLTPNEAMYKYTQNMIPVMVGFNRDEIDLYEFLLGRGKFPTVKARPAFEKTYGDMTDKEWREFVEIRGKKIKELYKSTLPSLKMMNQEQYDKTIERFTEIGNDQAINALKLRKIRKKIAQ